MSDFPPTNFVVPPPIPLPPPRKERRRGLGVLGTVFVSAVTAVVVGGVAGLGGYLIGSNGDENSSVSNNIVELPQINGAANTISSDVAAIAESVLPSVVSILIEAGENSGSGSGFIVQSDGYILTNNHVAAPAANGGELTVVFDNGDKVIGKIVGRNTSYDLAVLKVDRDGLPAAVLGDSSAVRVGEVAIAIGAPLGLNGTVTAGIISSLDRPVTAGGSGELAFINAIQTDAAINPGNSGGPLLDGTGRVIGINSAIATLAGTIGGESGSIGLGFSIPIDTAKRIAEELIATGDSQTPIIGVVLNTAFTGDGAKVSEITPGGPAEKAGVRVGDVITGLNGRQVADSTELVVVIRSYAPGEEIEITLTRNGQSSTVSLALGSSSKIG
ncbi:MAG: S1C family serine protease [Candidatus Nanopelagicales bacterium]|nr:trypsin-like peptidase domain-containing protein [Candidatus Nanopelagicales bacterium]